MFALVESGSITKMLNGNQGITIDGIQHPRAIYTLWTEAERNAIGVYTVEIDTTNRKDEIYYTNTDITYAFGSGKVTGSYGTATAKAIADVDAVDEDGNKVGNQSVNQSEQIEGDKVTKTVTKTIVKPDGSSETTQTVTFSKYEGK